MLTLVVTYTFPVGSEAAAEGHLRDLVAASRREPGCRRYEVFRMADTSRTFLIFEQYVDQDALEAHRTSEHFSTHAKAGIQPLAERRDAALYDDFA